MSSLVGHAWFGAASLNAPSQSSVTGWAPTPAPSTTTSPVAPRDRSSTGTISTPHTTLTVSPTATTARGRASSRGDTRIGRSRTRALIAASTVAPTPLTRRSIGAPQSVSRRATTTIGQCHR